VLPGLGGAIAFLVNYRSTVIILHDHWVARVNQEGTSATQLTRVCR
jgi:hypothetical protein